MIEARKLTALIKSIKGNAGKLRENIQSALIGCAYHAQVHRNVAAFDQLFEAVGNGTRIEGMTRWVKKYAPVHFVDGVATLSDSRQKDYKGEAAEYEAELADSAKWYDMQPKNDVQKEWDSVAELDNVISLLDKKAKQADKHDSVVAKVYRDLAIAARIQKTKLIDTMELVEKAA